MPVGPTDGSARLASFYALRSAVSRSVARSADRRQLMADVCQAALVDGHLRMAWIGFVHPDRTVRPEVWAGDEEGYLDQLQISARRGDRRAAGPSGTAILENRPVATRDIATEAAMAPWRDRALECGYRSSASFPLTRDGEPYGVLAVYSAEAGTFDAEEMEVLSGVAEDVSFGLEAREASDAARTAEARFRAAVDTLMAAFGLFSAVRDRAGKIVDFRIEAVNQAACDIQALTASELVGSTILATVPKMQAAGIFEKLVDVVETGRPLFVNSVAYGALLEGGDRAAMIADVQVSQVGDGFMAFMLDVTDRARTERELRDSEQRWEALVQNSSDVIAVVDADATVSYVSPAVASVLGRPPERVEGSSVYGLIPPPGDAAIKTVLADAVAGIDTIAGPFELRMAHTDGTGRWLSVTATNLLQAPSVAGVVFNARDVTDRHSFEERLEHQALHDPLTDLPNRALLLDRLEQALARSARSGSDVGVLFLDVDQFKLINDSRGHSVGDEALVRVAELVKTAVRPGDTVARFGGDEFAVIVEEAGDEEGLMDAAERVRAAVEGPLRLSGGVLHVTVSVGAVMSEQKGATELLASADAAMYRAKELGRNRSALFETEMREKAAGRLALEADLRQALGAGRLSVHYQPVVELPAGVFSGFEALARWSHPQRGLVSPAEFVPLAEETGLIVELGDWVLDEALRQLAEWSGRASAPGLSMAVNLSPRQLLDPGLAARVADRIGRAGVDAKSLTLEITETALMDNVDAAVGVLSQLKESEVRLAIDDFGTGYSSLGYLKRLPVDVLKIDRAFVAGLGVDNHDDAIAASIMLLAEALGLDVVAEGVERIGQLRQLRRLGCRLVQGFLWSPARSAEDIDRSFPDLRLHG